MGIKEDWQALANQLNFEFHEGINALINSPSPQLEQIMREEFPGKMQDIEKAKALLNTPFVQSMLSKIFLGMAKGTYKEFEFLIYRSTASSSSSNTKQYFVNIVLFFKKVYNLGMEITAAGFFSRLGKKLFPGSYVRIPNSELDPMLVIRGKNKEQIRTMLSYEKLQTQLMELFSYSKNFKITDYGIRLKEPGQIIPKEHIISLMDMMAKTGAQFY